MDYSQKSEMNLTDVGGCYLLEKGGNQGGNFSVKVATEKQAFLPKGGNQNQGEKDDIWLTRVEVETLLDVSHQAVKKACRTGRYRTILVSGNGGKQYRIALSSLPPAAQVKWVIENQSEAVGLPAHIKDALAPAAQWEIAKLTAPKEEVGMEILTNEAVKERLSVKIDLVEKALTVPTGWKKSLWIAKIAEDAGITRQTLYADIKKYKHGGLKALVKVRKKKGPTAWDLEALQYMEGVYVKALKEAGDCNKTFIYRAVIAEAEKQGWKIGSKSSAYDHLSKVHPLLIKYALGGKQALDNVFYIVRQYRDLAPFECIVGDQHRFDIWVHDRELDRVFRMDSFFWLDLRTRLVYGLSLTDNYSSYDPALAACMGVRRWGKFQKAYTDNGAPECSKFNTTVMNDLRAHSMRLYDISDMYRTPEGYAVENDNGEIIDVVDTPELWHRRARVRNAKAKLAERFFQTLENILLDLGVPGRVKELRGTSEEKAVADKRLKKLKEEGKLLTPEEFVLKTFSAVDIYNNRKHSALNRSPIDELWHAVKAEGFVPRMATQTELEYILMKREERRVNRGRVRVNKQLYEGVDLQHGLWDLPDKTPVEVRYVPFEYETAVAVRPDGAAVRLVRVPESSMKDPKLTAERMEWKRRMMKEVMEHYRKLASPVPGIIEYSTHTHAAHNLKKAVKKEAPTMTDAEYKASVDKIVAESLQPAARLRPVIARRPIFKLEYEYYKWCVESQLNGYAISESDMKFKRNYEAKMEESERIYWEEFIKNYFSDTKAVNEGRR